MKVINESRWEGDDVRALVLACAQRQKFSTRGVTVKIKTYRGRSLVSVVSSKKGLIVLKIGIPEKFVSDSVSALAAAAKDHPLGTVAGGARMAEVCAAINWGLSYANGVHYRGPLQVPDQLQPWAVGLVLRPKGKVRRVRLVGDALQKEKLAHAEEKLAIWQRKFKIAKTKVRKYEREIRRRKKVLTGAGFPGR